MSLFEGYERRIDKINEVCKKYGIANIEEARKICNDKGIDPYKTVEDLQPIAFENAK
ncbi:GGGtGRT protein, partial [Selenomonas sp.]|uniref:GGGtGRT protein n=1 Tax=Selenomonas sp. TaxID=2053611 RepID=UPI0025F2C010